jgi:type I restriction enzyme S subunit
VLAKQSSRVADLGSSKCVFDQRHVLYSKLRPYLNKVVVPDAPGVGTSELIPLVPTERLDREFLAYYLRSPEFVEFANANTRGANLPRIAMAEFWAHLIPIPPTLAEQRRVVARINACMERVEEIEALREQSLVQQQHLSTSLIESELHPDLAGADWTERNIGELVTTIRNGRSIGQATEDNADGAVLTLTAVRSIDLGLSYQKPISLPDEIATQFAIDEGMCSCRAPTRSIW